MMINYNHLAPEQAKHYEKLWETVEFTFGKLNFSDEVYATIVSIAVDLCGVCKAGTMGCQCWNDLE